MSQSASVHVRSEVWPITEPKAMCVIWYCAALLQQLKSVTDAFRVLNTVVGQWLFLCLRFVFTFFVKWQTPKHQLRGACNPLECDVVFPALFSAE